MSMRGALGALRRVSRDERLTVVEHLEELRRRVVVALVALVAAFALAFAFHDQLLEVLVWPLPDDQGNLITLSPTEPFFTVLKVSFWAAVVAAMPIWLYQLYAFVIPAVSDQPRRKTIAVITGVSSLFIAGVAFGFFVVLPVALSFLLDFGDGLFTTELRAGEYFGFVTTLLLASGLVFEVPVAMLAFARLGLASAELYRKNWRMAIVVIAVVAAILPGGDPFSMILLMIPQLVLYQVGIWLSSAFGAEPIWSRGAWADADGPPESGDELAP